jgi:ATP-binding cassette subfamily B (MDR/TAP) protein 8
MAHYGKFCDNVSASNKNMGLHIGLFQGLTNLSVGCMVLTVLYYGGSLVVRNELTSGDLMSYMLSTQTAQHSLVSLGVLFGQTIKAAASASRVFEFIHLQPVIPLRGGVLPESVKGDVKFVDVEFCYPARPGQKVLDRFELDVPSGTTVALCGPSGNKAIERKKGERETNKCAFINPFYSQDPVNLQLLHCWKDFMNLNKVVFYWMDVN